MRIGELKINGKDAATTWGAFMSDGSLSALMTPAPMKDYIENSSRATHGKDVLTSSAKVDARDLSLTIYIKASNREQFFARYLAFVTELQTGPFVIETMYQPGVLYRCIYRNCTQFGHYDGQLGKYTLKLTEPNPMNRQ